jgi:hypothetical protein
MMISALAEHGRLPRPATHRQRRARDWCFPLIPTEEHAMDSHANSTTDAPRHTPWNQGCLIGPKPPLKLREIWAIRIRL